MRISGAATVVTHQKIGMGSVVKVISNNHSVEFQHCLRTGQFAPVEKPLSEPHDQISANQ